MANSVNYQHFKTLMNVYEKAYLEKNKNACQNAVAGIWKNMKKDYSSSDELWKEVDRKASEWTELSITKKSKMTDFWSGVRKKSTNVTIKLPPTANQESTESSLEPAENVTFDDTHPQLKQLEWMELDDIETEGLVIPPVSSIKPGTPIIENSEAILSED